MMRIAQELRYLNLLLSLYKGDITMEEHDRKKIN